MASSNLTINDLSSATLEVHVRVSRQFHIRSWLGLKIIWLATRIMGCDLRVSTEVSDGQS